MAHPCLAHIAGSRELFSSPDFVRCSFQENNLEALFVFSHHWQHRVLWSEQSRGLELPRLYEEFVSLLSGSLCCFNLYQTFHHGCEVRVPNRPRNNLVPS